MFRIGGKNELFTVSLLGRFTLTGAKIPCYGVLVGLKLCVKRCAGCDRSDGVVELAACFGRVPALKAVSLFDRERSGDRRLAVRLDSFIVRCFMPVLDGKLPPILSGSLLFIESTIPDTLFFQPAFPFSDYCLKRGKAQFVEYQPEES